MCASPELRYGRVDALPEVQPLDDPGARDKAGEVLAYQGIGGSTSGSGEVDDSIGRNGLPPSSTADGGAFVCQEGHRHAPAIALLADHPVGGDPGAVHEDLVEVRDTGHLVQGAYLHTGLAHGEDQH